MNLPSAIVFVFLYTHTSPGVDQAKSALINQIRKAESSGTESALFLLHEFVDDPAFQRENLEKRIGKIRSIDDPEKETLDQAIHNAGSEVDSRRYDHPANFHLVLFTDSAQSDSEWKTTLMAGYALMNPGHYPNGDRDYVLFSSFDIVAYDADGTTISRLQELAKKVHGKLEILSSSSTPQ